MSRKSLIIVVSVVLVLSALAVGLYLWLRPAAPEGSVAPDGNEDGLVQPQEVTAPDSSQTTNRIVVFEDEFSADPMMVGKWQNTEKTGWYQVFYDDYDDENFFWGKEWDEEDDVMEEDLRYHGNGWFRWRKDGKILLEVSVQDQHSGDIPHEYTIRRLSDDELELEEREGRRRTYRFRRTE